MGVGAQNDLGGHQSFARKMTWKLPDKSIVFSVQFAVISKKKIKRSSLKLSWFIWPICGDLQKKKKGLHSHWDDFSVQLSEDFTKQTCPKDMKLHKILTQYCPKNMKLPEILTQNRPKYMKLPKILTKIWTPYTNLLRLCLRVTWIGSALQQLKHQNKTAEQKLLWSRITTIEFLKPMRAAKNNVLPANQRSMVIYEYLCHCDKRYVGRTTLKLQERIKQHVQKAITQKATPT